MTHDAFTKGEELLKRMKPLGALLDGMKTETDVLRVYAGYANTQFMHLWELNAVTRAKVEDALQEEYDAMQAEFERL